MLSNIFYIDVKMFAGLCSAFILADAAVREYRRMFQLPIHDMTESCDVIAVKKREL